MKINWQIKTLEEMCEVITRGISPKYIYKSGILVLNQRCIRNHVIDTQAARRHYHLAKSFEKNKLISIGDVLVNSTGVGTLGRVASVKELTEPTTVDSHVTIVRPKKDLLDKDFFGWMMVYVEEEITNSGAGASGQIELSRSMLKAILVSYPESLLEQKRIVKILDQVFEDIEKIKLNTEKNLLNIKELFESYLKNVFIFSQYERKFLGSVCRIIGGGTPSKTGRNFLKYYNGDIFWATVRDMRSDLIIDTEYKITVDGLKNSSTNIIPKNNVVIASRVGLGKVCLLKYDTAINQDLKGIIPIEPNNLSVNYLFWWLKSSAKGIMKNGSGATVQGIKLSFIQNMQIPYPSSAEQRLIAIKLDALSAETRKLEEIYTQKLVALEELKKSILKKAFAGDL
jgi:type I restriction enzyme S subunit